MLVASGKPTITRAELETILQVVSSLTLREAIDLLYSLKPSYLATPMWTEDRRKVTFGMLNKATWPKSRHTLCSKLGPIWFRGGPPGWKPRYNWIKSMASQFVADRVLCAVNEFGVKVVTSRLNTLLRQGAP